MKATLLARAIAITAEAKLVSMTWSEVGMGKSSIHRQVARARSRRLQDKRCAQIEAVDLCGIPYVKDNVTNWAFPNWLPRTPNLDIFFDELPQAPRSVQNALSELLLDRVLDGGTYTLPPDTCMFAAGNRMTDRAGTFEMPSHIKNRLIHLDLESDVDEWVKYRMDPEALPNVQLHQPQPADFQYASESVTAFIRFRPSLLQKFDPQQRAFPTARSVEYVIRLLPYILKEDKTLQYELISGCVGEGFSTEFAGFMRLITRMPDPDLVFRSPHDAPIPTEPGILYALCSALANRVVPIKGRNQNTGTANQMFIYLSRLPVEMAVTCVMDASIKGPITMCQEGIKWASVNAPYMI